MRLKYLNPAGIARRWWIVFHDGPAFRSWRLHWPNTWLRRGFRHCLVLGELGEQAVILNPLWSGVWLDYDPAGIDSVLAKLRPRESFHVVEIEAKHSARPIYPGLYNCVSFTKALLGISGWPVWTPYRLYRTALAMGGREVLR